MPGWNCTTLGITNFKELPPEMIAYVERISELVEAPVSIISTGPKRENSIIINPKKLLA